MRKLPCYSDQTMKRDQGVASSKSDACRQCCVASVRQIASRLLDSRLRQECARKCLSWSSRTKSKGAVNEPLLHLQQCLQLFPTARPHDGVSPFRMAFTFSQACQLPSLSVWHNLQRNPSNALFRNDTSQRNFENIYHQRTFVSSHTMSCRAVSVESKGEKGSTVFQHIVKL